MTTKQPSQYDLKDNVDYEGSSHTARKKKAQIKQSLQKKHKEEMYSACGFDDESDALEYERYLK